MGTSAYSKALVSIGLLAVSGFGLFPTQATAQEELALEEVVVTATKRAESLQDVPISIGVVTGELVRDLDIQNLTDLQAYVPSFTVQSTFGNWAVRVRGLGSGVTNLAFSSSVSIFNDGVYCGRSRCLEGGYLDVDRVEVARGPQGALFSNSTIAGAVSVISEKPTEEFEGYVRAGYEMENDGYIASAVISGPFSDNFRGRLAVKAEEIGGYIYNTYERLDEPEVKKTAIRGSLAWDASDTVTFNLKYEAASKDEDGNANQLVSPGLFGVLSQDPNNEYVGDDIRNVSTGDGERGFDDMDSAMAVLTMDAALGDHMLTAIAGYWELDYGLRLDVDGVPELYLNSNLFEDFDQQSVELRVLSPTGGTIDYIVGASYYKSDTRTRQVSPFGFIPLPFLFGMDRNFQRDTDAWSVYGQLTWHASERLRFTADVRYTEEEQDGTGWAFPVQFPDRINPVRDESGFSQNQEYLFYQTRKDEHFDPALRVQYDLTDDVMIYAAYATGSKPGGLKANDGALGDILLERSDDSEFLMQHIGQPTISPEEIAAGVNWIGQGNGVFDFEDEEADSFEIGAKMTLADGRANLNIAVFTMQFDNLQTSSYDGTRFIIANAASAEIDGIEIEANWQATDALRLFGAMSWLDAKYDEFFGAQCLVADEQGNFQDPDCVDGFEDLSGIKLERTPDTEVTLGANWESRLTESTLFRALVTFYYSDELAIRQDFHPLGIQDSYTKWDLRLAVADIDDRWEVALLGRNLSDEFTINHAYEIAGSNFVAYGNGRTVTLEGTWRW